MRVHKKLAKKTVSSFIPRSPPAEITQKTRLMAINQQRDLLLLNEGNDTVECFPYPYTQETKSAKVRLYIGTISAIRKGISEVCFLPPLYWRGFLISTLHEVVDKQENIDKKSYVFYLL